jgi:hypothetical protein
MPHIAASQLIQAAAEHRVILIPSRDELHIIARASAPAHLLAALRRFEVEILATLRGQQQIQRLW